MTSNVCGVTFAVLLALSYHHPSNCCTEQTQRKIMSKFKRPLLLKVRCYSDILLYFLNRNQSEVSNRGGIKALCGLLKTATNEKVSCARHLKDKCDS